MCEGECEGACVRVCKGGGWELEVSQVCQQTACGEPHLAQESYYKGRGQEVCTFPVCLF